METIDGRPVVVVDIETRSGTDLSSCGVYRYVEDPDFDILLTGYAVGDEDPLVLDHPALAKERRLGDAMSVLSSVIYDPGIVKVAHNAAFERTCFEKYLGRRCDPAEWIDTMVLAAYCGLPLSLDGCTKALGFGESTAKDARGKALIRLFSCPRKPTKDNPAIWVNPEDEPEKWQTYVDYNRQDVVAERALLNALYPHRPDETERRFWCLDQQINDRGIRIDRTFAANAQAVGQAYKAELFDKAVEITGLENPKSVAQVKDWLNRQEGISVASLNKKVVADVVAQLTTDKAREFMAIRSELSKSADAKYDAMLRAVCHDDHVRGCFQFYGSHTGRFSGRLVQLQNLKKNEMSDLAEARALVRTGDLPTVEALYGQVSNTLGELVRTALIPEPGQRFIVSDFSAIEARVTAWLSGEENTLRAFRDGEDIYCATASSMFGVPVEKHGANAALRQKGKIAVLACVAKGQPVLTDQGLVPIEDVTTDMMVWDGEEFVSHDGVAFNGYREVIEYEGLQATADHLVWVEGEPEPVRFGWAAGSGAHLVQSGAGGFPLRLGAGHKPGEKMEQIVEPLLCSHSVRGVRHRAVAALGKPAKGCLERMPVLFKATCDTEVAGQKTYRCKAEMHKSERPRLPGLRRAWDTLSLQFCGGSRKVHDVSTRVQPGTGDRQDRHERGLCPRKSTMGSAGPADGKSPEHGSVGMGREILAIREERCDPKAVVRHDPGGDHRGRGAGRGEQEKELARYIGKVAVYDIRNAGRNHRYTVSGKLVHNCGYGGGVNALKAFGADKMGLSEEDMADIVDKWRASSPRVCAMWKGMERAAIKAVARKTSTRCPISGTVFDWRDGLLWLILPSGRRLAYYGAEYGDSRLHPGKKTLSYMTTEQKSRKWMRVETWGGKLVENLVQAVARDILRDKMLALDDAGFDIRAHIHDEVVITAAQEQTLEEVNAIMGTPLDWCPDLPLRGDGYYCDFYMKD